MNVVSTTLLLTGLICSTGCVRGTTLHVQGAGAVRGTIESSDAEHVYLRTSKNLKPRAVPRRDIVDVDHSGSVSRFVGIPIALVGAGIMTYGAFIYDFDENCEGACFDPTVYIVLLGAVVATPGIVTSLVGFMEYGASSSHFDDAPAAKQSASVTFGVAPTPDGVAAGLAGTF